MNIPEGILGIDVSAYQMHVDWAAVAASGVRFAYVRAFEGVTPDPMYERHVDAALKAGLLVGAYQFFRPRHPSKQLADLVLALPTMLDWTLPFALDVEANDNVAPEQLKKQLQEYVQYMDTAIGEKTVIYGGPGFWDSRVSKDHGLGDHLLWLADYNAKPTLPRGWTSWTFWQFTESYQCAGIPAPVDASVFGGTEEELNALATSNPVET